MLSENQEKTRREIAKKLTAKRLMQGLTQQEVAEKMGTKKSNISRFEQGGQNAGIDYIAAYAEALGQKATLMMEELSDYGEENTEYSLRLYDEELLQFSMVRSSGIKIRIRRVNEEKRYLLPVGLELTDEGLFSWLDRRIIPSGRAFVGEILSAWNLNRNDLKGIIDICKGLSLNDSYWVVRKDSLMKFDDYNLFENDFSEILALVAYTGRPYSERKIMSSPEFTTNGVLRKAWRNKGAKGIWLYKGGTEDFANAGNEPYIEFYACQVAKKMGLSAVSYELENWKGILASKCRLFTSRDVSYVSIGRIVTRGGIEAVLDYYKTLGPSYYDALCSMLIFDCVICNEDRHFGNFGLLRDNHTGDFLAPAPIFDNGNSLLCYAMPDDFKDISVYLKGRTTPYGLRFEEVAALALGPEQKARLRKLINFRFAESNLCNLPSWRLRALEQLISLWVENLLAM